MTIKLKVVVFGRGTGESILVELEENKWMVVDCFNNPKTKEPAPISYLKSIGLNPADVICKVVITHFHQDHVSGMYNLIRSISSDAKIYLSQAMTVDEAKTYYSEIDILNNDETLSGISEFCKIINLLNDSGRKVVKLKQDSMVYMSDDIAISAISPSEFDNEIASQGFVALINESRQHHSVSQAKKKTPNNFCVALCMKCLATGESIVLGSDLEICGDPRSGWDSAISSETGPSSKSIRVMKIAHHGSHNGFHQPTWDNFTNEGVIAVLTTFDRQKLPRGDFVKKYKLYTNSLLSTTKPKSKLEIVLPKSSQKKIESQKGFSVNVRGVSPKSQFGYVETFKRENTYEYNLYGDAVKL
ncbi:MULTISPECIES: MBL fold metallo-hydrolase [Vibrio]|uniref:MBL fold metallo-hydrolase n=1 Tax=Vibrio atlanticus TaxID=693153 RepID=A0ABV4KUJ3_9VIBR